MVGGGHVPKNPTPTPTLRHCEAERYRCQVGCENTRARENWSRRGNNNNKHPGGRAQRMRGPYHRDDCAAPGADDQSRPFNSITRDPTGRRCAELIKPKRSGRFRCFASRCFNYSKVITRAEPDLATPPRPIAPGPVFGTVSAPAARDYSWKVIGNKLEFHRASEHTLFAGFTGGRHLAAFY